MTDPVRSLIEQLHVLIAEIRRCVDDDRLVRAVDKLSYTDDTLKELSAVLGAVAPQPAPERETLKAAYFEGFNDAMRLQPEEGWENSDTRHLFDASALPAPPSAPAAAHPEPEGAP